MSDMSPEHMKTMGRLAEAAFALQRLRYEHEQLRKASQVLIEQVEWLTLRKAQRPHIDAAVEGLKRELEKAP